MRKSINCIVFLSVAALILFVGCSGDMKKGERLEHLEKHWGKSFEMARDNQILNPEAGKTVKPVMGLNGQAADGGWESLIESYKGKMQEAPTSPIGK